MLNFAAPVFFLLAGVSSVWTKEKSNWARWITSGVVLMILVPLIRREHGWKLYAEAAGGLICLVFIHDLLLGRPSVIAITSTVTYGITQGVSLSFWLLNYWDFGGSIPYLHVEITPLFLVAASLLVAVATLLTGRERTLDKGQT
jgi:hypothetical protein